MTDYRSSNPYRAPLTYRGTAAGPSATPGSGARWGDHRRWRDAYTWNGAAAASVQAATWHSRQQWGGSQSWRGLATAPPLSGFDPSVRSVGWNVPRPAVADAAGRALLWARLVATGANFVRTDAYWASLQPTAGGASVTAGMNDAFDATAIAQLDAFVSDAAANGIKVWLNCAYSPAWARPGHSGNPRAGDDHIPPTRNPELHYPDFANFVYNICARYEQRNPGTVVAVSPWNEPNLSGFWAQPPGTSSTGASWSPDAVEYGKLLLGAYNAVHSGTVEGRPNRAAFPYIHVAAFSTAPASGAGAGDNYEPATFIAAAIWAAGTAQCFDQIDVHPYCWQFGPNEPAYWNAFRQIHDVWAVAQFFARTDAYVWCSEIGAISRPDESGTDPASPWGVGGYDSNSAGAPSSGGWYTSQRAISYTLADQRVTETFNAWRGAGLWDSTIGRQITGAMCWYALLDADDGIRTAWADESGEPYFGFYEWGTTQYDGPLKGELLATWESFVDPDSTAPIVNIYSPSQNASVNGQLAVVAVAVDDRDNFVGDVRLLVDGNDYGLMTWYFVNAITVDTAALSNGVHTLQARARDLAGNVALSPTVTIFVDNAQQAVVIDDPSSYDPLSPWRWYVRDAQYQRVAELSPTAEVEAVLRYNEVGSWTVQCMFDDVCTPLLLAQGAGVEVRYKGAVVFTGFRTEFDRVLDDNTDAITFAGVTDLQLVADREAHPNPALADFPGQFSVDAQSGPAEDVVRHYVDANIGAAAVPARRHPGFVCAPSLGRGASVSVEARMENLLDLVRDAAIVGGVRFDAAASPSVGGVIFAIDVPANRANTVFLARQFGNLAGYRYGAKRPTVTQLYIGDSGEADLRYFTERTDDAAIALYGRIEGFISGQSGDTLTTITQALAQLIEARNATNEVQLSPRPDIIGSRWPDDFQIGDTVTAFIDDTPVVAAIDSVKIARKNGTVSIEPSIGGGVLDNAAALAVARNLSRRTRNLERT